MQHSHSCPVCLPTGHLHSHTVPQICGVRAGTECRDSGPGPHSFNTCLAAHCSLVAVSAWGPGSCPESVYGKVVDMGSTSRMNSSWWSGRIEGMGQQEQRWYRMVSVLGSRPVGWEGCAVDMCVESLTPVHLPQPWSSLSLVLASSLRLPPLCSGLSRSQPCPTPLIPPSPVSLGIACAVHVGPTVSPEFWTGHVCL